ncbi:MAG: carboxyl-terminal processing protease [Solirubrobacteraceae bacterium]|jgi:carboxyl-terminal processing protease|nr:carboxyl-terminal processing protease [Solirubrobacteraceae bacterium]
MRLMLADARARSAAALAFLMVLAVLLVGIYLGGHPSDLPGFLQNLSGSQATVVDQAVDELMRDYYVPVSRSTLDDHSLAGLVAGLGDRFSSYLTPKEYHDFTTSAGQQFEGIGVTVLSNKLGLEITHVFAGSPAARAGLATGDIITAAGGKSLAGKTEAAGSGLIKGRSGTAIVLGVRHAGRLRQVSVTRAEVHIPVVAAVMRTYKTKQIADVELATFSSGAHAEVRAAVDRLLKQGARGIVFDLRHNGGGLVVEARLIASIFLPDGPIVTTRGRTQPTVTLTAVGNAIPRTIPVAVLVDKDTASAAEIVSGALQDRHRATIVGTHTFGKGVFQEVTPLSNGGALDITVGEYFLPSGRNLGGGGIKQGAGITPDVPVTAQPKPGSDPAMTAALGVVAAKLK